MSDGVVFHVEGNIVVGEAEIDPPGGWAPFRMALQSGEQLPSEVVGRVAGVIGATSEKE